MEFLEVSEVRRRASRRGVYTALERKVFLFGELRANHDRAQGWGEYEGAASGG